MISRHGAGGARARATLAGRGDAALLITAAAAGADDDAAFRAELQTCRSPYGLPCRMEFLASLRRSSSHGRERRAMMAMMAHTHDTAITTHHSATT